MNMGDADVQEGDVNSDKQDIGGKGTSPALPPISPLPLPPMVTPTFLQR